MTADNSTPSWRRYLRFWTQDPAADVDDEISFHLEMRVRDLVARGMTEANARARATSEFGEVDPVRTECLTIDSRVHRRATVASRLDDLLRDAHVAVRSLARTPTFTVTAILCAALGIGVTSTIVSAAHAILNRPLPYRDADRLVAVYGENTVRGYRGTNISYPDFVDWRDRNQTFAALGMWTWDTKTIAAGNEAERVSGAEVTANLFPILGVIPAMGRTFTAAEEQQGGPSVALISHRIWTTRFARDSAIVGKSVPLDGRAFTIVGVMPERFNFPDRGDIWTPFVTNPAQEQHHNRGYAGAIGRLKPGVGLEQARADMNRVSAAMAREIGDQNYGWRAELIPMREDLVGDLQTPLKVFLGGVLLVLIMVCANVASLMLARATLRSREIAVRAALGASRGRLAGQLLTESLVIAGAGGVVGIGIAIWGARLLRFAFPDETPPFFIDLSVHPSTLAIVVAVTLVTGVAAGMIPAFSSTRVDLDRALRDGGRASGAGTSRARMRGTLVVAEVALSIVLMIGAALLLRSYRALEGTNLGFSERDIVSARITLPSASYPDRANILVFFERLTDRLKGLPGVASIGTAQGVPFSGWDVQGYIAFDGRPAPKAGEELVSHFQWVSPDYFTTIGVPLISGRWFTAADRDSLAPAVLVNQTFVKRAYPNENPIGKRIRIGGEQSRDPWATIVGVVGDYRHYRLPQPMGPAMYMPYRSNPARTQTIVIRTAGADPHSIIPALRGAVRELDPQIALYQVRTFEEVVSRSLWRQRLQGNVVGIFALLALALASLGLYGVISYAVAQRTREIGVRMALGSSRVSVAGLVLRQTMALVFVGVVIGLVGAAASTRLLRTLLYEITPSDPLSFVGVPVLLVIVALVAVWAPTMRATKVDPLVAMRAE